MYVNYRILKLVAVTKVNSPSLPYFNRFRGVCLQLKFNVTVINVVTVTLATESINGHGANDKCGRTSVVKHELLQ